MSAPKTVLASAAMIAVLGAGYGMWVIISTGESRRTMDLPKADPYRMDESRRKTALVMQALKEASETNENIARSR